ncbi:hypothetical protein KXV37_007752 [Aspergillus fumigatus]|nr:hypothetical protein KXV37_007752 [Aspergillus fumigatus]
MVNSVWLVDFATAHPRALRVSLSHDAVDHEARPTDPQDRSLATIKSMEHLEGKPLG